MSDDFFESEAEKFIEKFDEGIEEDIEEEKVKDEEEELKKLFEKEDDDKELDSDFSFNKVKLSVGKALDQEKKFLSNDKLEKKSDFLSKDNKLLKYSDIEFSEKKIISVMNEEQDFILKQKDEEIIYQQTFRKYLFPDITIFDKIPDLVEPDENEDEREGTYEEELEKRVALAEDDLNMMRKLKDFMRGKSMIEEDVLTKKVEQHPDIDKKKLHEWQKKAIDFFFDNDGVALYEVATGAGKTHLAIQLIKKIIEKEKILVLIVVPKNVILKEGWYKALIDSGISEKEIGLFYAGKREINTITLTNMQSIGKVPVQMFDFIVLDEAHNYTSTRMIEILKKGKFKYRVGLTATLYDSNLKHKLIKLYFRRNIFKYDITKAISDDIINAFKFITYKVIVDDETIDEYLKLTEEINSIISNHGSMYYLQIKYPDIYKRLMYVITQRKKLIANYYGKFEVVQKIIEKNRFKKVIVFNEFNQQTSALYWHLIEKNIEAKVIHSGVAPKVRDKLIKDYQDNKFNILLVTKIFDEGYNLPSIDVGIIMSGESTDRQFIQRMGRVLRKKDYLSEIYYIYCANTFEEEYYKKRVRDVSKYAKEVVNIDENFSTS